MVDISVLNNVKFFENFSNSQLCEVQKICGKIIYKNGENIFNSGDDPRSLYFVLSGRVGIMQSSDEVSLLKGKVIAAMTKDMILGWSSLVPPYKYTLTARCLSDECTLLFIDRIAFLEICESDHDLGFKVMSKIVATVGSRFDQFREKLITTLGHDLINQWYYIIQSTGSAVTGKTGIRSTVKKAERNYRADVSGKIGSPDSRGSPAELRSACCPVTRSWLRPGGYRNTLY